jgi:hypothetical protein
MNQLLSIIKITATVPYEKFCRLEAYFFYYYKINSLFYILKNAKNVIFFFKVFFKKDSNIFLNVFSFLLLLSFYHLYLFLKTQKKLSQFFSLFFCLASKYLFSLLYFLKKISLLAIQFYAITFYIQISLSLLSFLNKLAKKRQKNPSPKIYFFTLISFDIIFLLLLFVS